MKLSEMKEQSFPEYEFDKWKSVAEKSLKGKTLESLQRTTYENIVLKPLYTSEDAKPVSQFPGEDDFRRGIDPLGYLTNNWKIAQRFSCTILEELEERLKQALESGQTALSFIVTKEMIETKGFLEKLIGEYYSQFPLAIDAGKYQSEVLSAIETVAQTQEKQAKANGYVAWDPLSDLVVNGKIPDQFASMLEEFSKTIQKANENFPHLRTLLVNTTPYHNGGANAVQELGIAAATGVFYLHSLSGLDAEKIINKLIFNFSVGSNFFMEIAKLRAARIIWNKIAEVYKISESSRGMHIAAETSLFTNTLYDPYVNLLRGGNEAFAAAIGGVQYLNVHAFDHLTGSTSFSERIARNIQLILQEEAQLKKLIDPSGGSWYVEKLTNELAQQAWGFFQKIEANGGILEALKTNWLQEQISEVYEKRKQDIFTRKQSIIGTNAYANLDDAVPVNSGPQNANAPFSGEKEEYGANIRPIQQMRLSLPYEELRKRADNLKRKFGLNPSVGLICLGSLKQHKARADYVRGFLSAGGITVQTSEPIDSPQAALEFAEKAGTRHFCVCGTNEIYQDFGFELLKSLAAKSADWIFYLAGLPEQEEQAKWLGGGIKQFIHLKSNCFEMLSAILSEMEVSVNE